MGTHPQGLRDRPQSATLQRCRVPVLSLLAPLATSLAGREVAPEGDTLALRKHSSGKALLPPPVFIESL